MTHIRKPGGEFTLTDEELLITPIVFLSPAQRRLRRALKRNKQQRKNALAKKERQSGHTAKLKFCQSDKKDGSPCRAGVVQGAKHCVFHLSDEERIRLDRPKPSPRTEPGGVSVEKRERIKRNAPQLMRELVEVAVEKVMQRYFSALGLDFVGFNDEGDPVIVDKGAQSGLVLHGESKEGTIKLSDHPDLVGQIAVAEKMFDRVYGKARQTQVIEGGIKPVRVEPVRTQERAANVATFLQHVGALGGAPPHEGRRRSDAGTREHESASVTDPVGVTDDTPTNVTELHPKD